MDAEDFKNKVAEILKDNITFAPQVGSYVIHRALEKIWELHCLDLKHSPNCLIMQDWTEAQQALYDCPQGADKMEAYEEMRKKMNTCTCGLKQ